ncbi:MAG: hypothetical protein ACE5EK_04505 [Nitrospinales bacterium]
MAITLIISYVVVSLYGIYQGSQVNYLGLEISPKGLTDKSSEPEGAAGMSTHEFIAKLPIEVQGTPEESQKKITVAVSDYTEINEDVVNKQIEIEKLRNQLKIKEDELAKEIDKRIGLERKIKENENKFLDKILRLDAARNRWDRSISLEVKVEEKEEIFRLVQELLQKIGYYDGPIDADPLRTREALRKYKEDKGFKNEKYWTTVTDQTVIFMVRDYAETLLKESRG